ncbi:PAS domain S-box/diguanylate cyclase (GGDEF) domain-containing protein [Beggiatoa alba B18LD]|uniref:cyclic-guanylate-specific phosphodiesterase n=1 Tax=Beggiatoa alba B18LD TaxID=395493 RepID=I3CEV7_9GAMM|nr:EAL domain-containing protein [Beggiatoa alba]EIJ42150.1 PAS domain S-box/diguanylate cyclase (GGDEF) domain-containing protein [Beggiatoa alba B18LD]
MPNFLLKKPYLALLLVTFIGLSLSFTSFTYTKQWETQAFIQEKEVLLNQYIRLLRQSSLTINTLLNSLRSLYTLQQQVKPDDFNLLTNQELLNDWIYGFLWLPRIDDSQRQAIEQQLARPFWDIDAQQPRSPAPIRAAYYPVLLAEPQLHVENLQGLDLSQNYLHPYPSHSYDSRLITINNPQQPTELQLHVFLPIYDPITQPHIAGFFTIVLRINTFIETLLRPAKQRQNLFLVIRDANTEQLIYAPTWYKPTDKKILQNNILRSIPLDFEGQHWQIELQYLAENTGEQYHYAWIVLLVGCLFTAGLVRYLYVIINNGVQTEQLVQQRTQNLLEVNQTLSEEMQAREQMTLALIAAEKKYRAIFENAIEGIFQCDPDGHFLRVNPAFVRMFAFHNMAEICAIHCHNNKINLFLNTQQYQSYLNRLNRDGEVKDFEYQAVCANQEIIWVSETTKAVYDKLGKLTHYEGIIENITERKKQEEKLRYAASHDTLTGLHNRSAFTERLTTLIKQQHAHFLISNIISFAVLFVDLDRFKIVNDSMGHLVGDKLLQAVAKRLLTSTQHANTHIARFGGDEFALLMEKISNLNTLEQYIENIQKQLSQPYELEGETFVTTASIGIALSSAHYLSADEVLRDADTAMYAAKKQGLGKYAFFQPKMHTHVVHLMRMEADLRKAFEREELQVYYQPIISLENQHTVGLEALVRWQHPQRGLIPPDEFIPLAEETGMIQELGRWVFQVACKQLRKWQQRYPQHAQLGININVSAIQFKQPRLVRDIQDILEKTGVSPRNCRIEITESAMMYNPEETLKILKELKELELQLYIDDFGTGYSSLSYLQKFPIDALKIDKSFIRDLDNDKRSYQIAQAIIALGEAFNLKTVAEGVETQKQLSLLKSVHCHQVQGFLFSRPKPLADIENYLQHH